MGNRLSRIYTRTGDDGSTGLGDGTRVRKDSLRVEAYGTVDELNSALGVLHATNLPSHLTKLIAAIQQRLFDLGGELCIPGACTIDDTAATELEELMDSMNAGLPPLREFILPGGSQAAAACHVARAVCRRAERRLCSLAEHEAINPDSLRYLNRLSDLLFVIARVLNHLADGEEVFWTGGKTRRD